MSSTGLWRTLVAFVNGSCRRPKSSPSEQRQRVAAVRRGYGIYHCLPYLHIYVLPFSLV
jgi:hypothetical protein